MLIIVYGAVGWRSKATINITIYYEVYITINTVRIARMKAHSGNDVLTFAKCNDQM